MFDSSLCLIFSRWQTVSQSRIKKTGTTLYFSLRSDEESNYLLSQQAFIAQLSCFSGNIIRLDCIINSLGNADGL